jgi:hypothetical protein
MWVAIPTEERTEEGIGTIGAFAEKHNISRITLWRWKQREDFKPRVKELRQRWASDKTSDVVNGVYRAATKNLNPAAQKLWLQYFEDFTEKSQHENIQKVEIGVNDIRFLIEQLPEPMKSQHYANLRQLLDDVTAFQNARESESSAGADGLTQALPGETNQPTQDVSVVEADEVPESDPGSVREDMEREV